jgi:hypothetical protein
LNRIADRFRRENELWDREHIDAWLAANHMEVGDFDLLMQSEARINDWLRSLSTALLPALIDQLRLTGEYSVLAERARDKSRCLANRVRGRPPDQQLVHWYFERRSGRPFPDDLGEFAREIGFATQAQFIDAIAGEYAYLVESAD